MKELTTLAPVSERRYRAPERFDVHQVERFRRELADAPGDVVVDLGMVRFIDGTALNALVEMRADLLSAQAEVWLDGIMEPAWVIEAYRRGFFPWPVDERLAW